MHYLCNRTSVGLPFGIFESVGTELIFPKPIRNPSDFGSEPKLMLPLRSDGHPNLIFYTDGSKTENGTFTTIFVKIIIKSDQKQFLFFNSTKNKNEFKKINQSVCECL